MKKSICFMAALTAYSIYAAQRGAHEWITVGKHYRVVSNPGSITQGAKSLTFLQHTWQLQTAMLLPEKGDSPQREAKIKLLKGTVDAEGRSSAVSIPYNTPTIALSLSSDRDRFGLPQAVLVQATAGTLRGKKFWVKYASVRPSTPMNGEVGIIQSKSVLYAPIRSADVTKLKHATGADASSFLANQTAFPANNGDKVRVVGTSVAGLLYVRFEGGPNRGKKVWVPIEMVASQ